MARVEFPVATPAAFGGGPCNRVYGVVGTGASLQDPALLIPPGGAVPAKDAEVTLTPLRPIAATAGALMNNLYTVLPTAGQAAALAERSAAALTTPWSFGPFTNASVMAFDAVPAVPGLGLPAVAAAQSRLVAMGRPWPVAETAVGYVGQQDWGAARGTLAPVPLGPGCFLPSWPGSSVVTGQGTWTATPWVGSAWGCIPGGGLCPALW